MILDEKKARSVASNMSIQPVGVARILFRLQRDGQIEDAGKLINRLKRELKFRISEDVIKEASLKAEEPMGLLTFPPVGDADFQARASHPAACDRNLHSLKITSRSRPPSAFHHFPHPPVSSTPLFSFSYAPIRTNVPILQILVL